MVPVEAQANLTLTKQPSDATPAAGTSFSWTLVAHNDGPSDAAGPLTITDTLPAYRDVPERGRPVGVQSGAGATCPDRSADRHLHPPERTTGRHRRAIPEMLVQLSADAPTGSQTNTATVTSTTPGNAGTGSGTITIQRSAKLSITKTHSGPGVVGQPIDFHIQVHNAGPSTADQVVVTDPLPAGLTYISATGTDWTCVAPSNRVTCQLAGTLAAGVDSPPITLTVHVGPAAYPRLVNVATVTSTDPAIPGQASASDPLTVDPTAGLALTKRHTTQFIVGEPRRLSAHRHQQRPHRHPGPNTDHRPPPGRSQLPQCQRHRMGVCPSRRKSDLHPHWGTRRRTVIDPDRHSKHPKRSRTQRHQHRHRHRPRKPTSIGLRYRPGLRLAIQPCVECSG